MYIPYICGRDPVKLSKSPKWQSPHLIPFSARQQMLEVGSQVWEVTRKSTVKEVKIVKHI